MSKVLIYHNPHCSKSRAALLLLQEHSIAHEVIEYLNNPPDKEALHALVKKLGPNSRDLVRTNDSEFAQTGCDAASLTELQIVECILQFPKLLQRPVVINGELAAIGRPPEKILEIL